MVQTSRNGHTLSVSCGVAVFDGELVGEENRVVEEIKFEDLPFWAMMGICKAKGSSSQVQISVGRNNLQINTSGSFFNGQKVVF